MLPYKIICSLKMMGVLIALWFAVSAGTVQAYCGFCNVWDESGNHVSFCPRAYKTDDSSEARAEPCIIHPLILDNLNPTLSPFTCDAWRTFAPDTYRRVNANSKNFDKIEGEVDAGYDLKKLKDFAFNAFKMIENKRKESEVSICSIPFNTKELCLLLDLVSVNIKAENLEIFQNRWNKALASFLASYAFSLWAQDMATTLTSHAESVSKVTNLTDRRLFQSLFLEITALTSDDLQRADSCLDVYKRMSNSILDDYNKTLVDKNIKNRLKFPTAVDLQNLKPTKENITTKVNEFCKNLEEERAPAFFYFGIEDEVGHPIEERESIIAMVPMKNDSISVLICPQMLQFKATKDDVANELFNILLTL